MVNRLPVTVPQANCIRLTRAVQEHSVVCWLKVARTRESLDQDASC